VLKARLRIRRKRKRKMKAEVRTVNNQPPRENRSQIKYD
jgi:hypothetical protein